MIKVKVEVLPMNVDEVARVAVDVKGQDRRVVLESGGNSSHTFDLEDGQELVVGGKMVGRMVLNRDQRATQYEYAEGEEPKPQSAYDPDKDPEVQRKRKEEEDRRQGRRSPSAFVDPNAKPMGEAETGSPPRTRFTPIEDQTPAERPTTLYPETETQAAARRLREDLQKRDTTGAGQPTSGSTTPSMQATEPTQPVSPASRPSSAESKAGSTEPVAASAPGGAQSSKDVKDDGAKGKTS